MAGHKLTEAVAILLALVCLLQQVTAQATAEPTNKLDPSLSVGFATVMVTVLGLTIVVTMCLAVGS